MENSTTSKHKRIEFDGTNYIPWLQSLMIEAEAKNFHAYFEKEIADAIRKWPTPSQLELAELQQSVENQTQHKLQLEKGYKNIEALALIKSTLRSDFREFIKGDKLAYDAVETMKKVLELVYSSTSRVAATQARNH